MEALWTMVSMPAQASITACLSQIFRLRNFTSSRKGLPPMSSTVTSWPRSAKPFTRLRPMKPQPPVTSTLRFCGATFFVLVACMDIPSNLLCTNVSGISTKHLVPERKDRRIVAVQMLAMVQVVLFRPEIEKLEHRVRQIQIGVHQDIHRGVNEKHNQERQRADGTDDRHRDAQQTEPRQVFRWMQINAFG